MKLDLYIQLYKLYINYESDFVSDVPNSSNPFAIPYVYDLLLYQYAIETYGNLLSLFLNFYSIIP